MKHFTIKFKPDEKEISIHAGATLVEAAGLAGIILNTACGERGICGKCAVTLEPDSREVLACQYHVQSDLTVTIGRRSRFFQQKILAEGIAAPGGAEPDIYKKYRQTDTNTVLGLAVDIGTTTVVVKLIDMVTGSLFATESALNPQTRFGDDVISRISYASTGDRLAELQKAIIDCLNDLVDKLCKKTTADSSQIYEASIVGNTTMNHIFLKLPIAQLGQAPYNAYSLDARDLSPSELPLKINPEGNIHTIENIAGFVGADTVAVALAAGADSVENMTLVVDIGTNGEIVLGTKDKLCAASCAAGPAFEGARITCGSRAIEGAIEAVVVNADDIDVDAIGDSPPHSICGSGLIDAVACLLDLGIIDHTGRFADPEKLNSLPPKILNRLTERQGQPTFILDQSAGENPVFLSQRDIREVQLAKAAIRAGIKLLQKKLDLADTDIQQVFLAGAFGNYIRKESALRIGLLPNVPIERIHSVGNAASSGAQLALISSKFRRAAKQLARQIEYIEIAHEPDFQNTFADSMLF